MDRHRPPGLDVGEPRQRQLPESTVGVLEGRERSGGAGDHESHVPVEDPVEIVVASHDDRPADVVAPADAGLGQGTGRESFDGSGPAGDTEGSESRGAEDFQLRRLLETLSGIALESRPHHPGGACRRLLVEPGDTRPVFVPDPCHLAGAVVAEQLHRDVGLAEPDGVGERRDLGVQAETVVVLEQHDARPERANGRPFDPRADDLAEHGARLDARELVRVPDQHERRPGAYRVEQAGHHRQGHHRRLVHDHEIVGQRVGAVVAGFPAGVGP